MWGWGLWFEPADMCLIASFCNTIPFTIFTPATVKTAVDLKGSTVGISSFGSESDIATARIAPSASRPSHPRANRGESGGKTRVKQVAYVKPATITSSSGVCEAE